MESEIHHLWQVTIWGLGLCSGGFVTLCSWIWMANKGCHQRMDNMAKDIEDSLVMKKELVKISTSIEKIEIAILGSYERPFDGVIHKQNDTAKKTKELEDRVKKLENN